MKSEDDIRRALETIRPSEKLIQETLQRAKTETAAALRKPWPLAVNGVLAILVLAITLWTLGDAGLFTRGGAQTNGDMQAGATSGEIFLPIGREAATKTDGNMTILPVNVPDLSLTVLSADGRMSVYCAKNTYSLMMSDIIGLNIQPYLMQGVPAIGMLVYEVTASSGTMIDDRAFLPSQQATVTTPAGTAYTDPVKIPPDNLSNSGSSGTPSGLTTPVADITAVSPANPTSPLLEYAFGCVVRINGNPELVKTTRLFWSPMERDTIPEPGIDTTVTINAYLENGTEKTPVSTMTLSVKYNTADRLYAFDPKPIG